MSPLFFSKEAKEGYVDLVRDIRGYRARHTEGKPIKELPTQNLSYHGVSALRLILTGLMTTIGVILAYTIWQFVARWF